MKKSLIALAALAFVSVASAQSTVTLSGNLDFAAANGSGTNGTNGQTISTGKGTSSTSVIRFIAVEDLGGGMKATAQYNFDPRSLANDSTAVTNNYGASTTTGSLGATLTGLARDEMFVGLSGGFGNIRLGSPNAIGLRSFLDSSPLGTGVGSAYAANGVAGTITNSYVQTRYNRSVSYDSPSINGFTASAMYAPGGDEAAVAASTAAITAGASNVAFTALSIPNARQATELGLAYAQGPLKVSYAYVAQGAQTNATGWYGAAASTASTSKTSVSLINANYQLGKNTTLYAGWNKGDALAATAAAAPTATQGYRVAVKHGIGAISLMAQYTTQNSRTAAGVVRNATVAGLRADYSLSKTAAIYLGYENANTGAATANIHKITSVGLRKSF